MEELIRKSEAYSAVLHSNPANAYCILRIKPVEAVEVVHGYWIYKPFAGDEDVWLNHCSECDAPSARRRNYCPECGAKMDLEECK